MRGRIKKIIGNIVVATAPNARLGDVCELYDRNRAQSVLAEVVGLDGATATLSPLEKMEGLSTELEVRTTGKPLDTPVGRALLGRVLDGFGRPADREQKGPLPPLERRPLVNTAPPPLSRNVISKPLSLGVRAIDGMLTCGEGQRIGIYGAPGTGKSLLLAQIVRMSQADVTVIALVGERGREVREFIERHLTPEHRARTVIVVSTSDRSPVERVRASQTAMTIAEAFRDQGARVLLVVDSVTRLARALREIGLSAGEPPTRRGYPPSVFAELPALFERAGLSNNGSITAIFTVLTEGDAATDPVAEETRGLLDGHIVLSTKLAQSGAFPAIDVTQSLSRIMMDVVSPDHQKSAQKVRRLLSKYAEIEFLIQVGEYKAGTDPEADEAIARKPAIEAFLRQAFQEKCAFQTTVEQLVRVVS
jgi:type III secretion protein N (ATPase)